MCALPISFLFLDNAQTAVDGQALSGDVACLVASEEDHRFGDLLRRGHPSHRDLLDLIPQSRLARRPFLVECCLRHLREREARSDCIDTDTLWSELFCHACRELDDT